MFASKNIKQNKKEAGETNQILERIKNEQLQQIMCLQKQINELQNEHSEEVHWLKSELNSTKCDKEIVEHRMTELSEYLLRGTAVTIDNDENDKKGNEQNKSEQNIACNNNSNDGATTEISNKKKGAASFFTTPVVGVEVTTNNNLSSTTTMDANTVISGKKNKNEKNKKNTAKYSGALGVVDDDSEEERTQMNNRPETEIIDEKNYERIIETLNDQIVTIQTSCDGVVKSMKEEIGDLMEEKCSIELDLLNQVSALDNDRREIKVTLLETIKLKVNLSDQLLEEKEKKHQMQEIKKKLYQEGNKVITSIDMSEEVESLFDVLSVPIITPSTSSLPPKELIRTNEKCNTLHRKTPECSSEETNSIGSYSSSFRFGEGDKNCINTEVVMKPELTFHHGGTTNKEQKSVTNITTLCNEDIVEQIDRKIFHEEHTKWNSLIDRFILDNKSMLKKIEGMTPVPIVDHLFSPSSPPPARKYSSLVSNNKTDNINSINTSTTTTARLCLHGASQVEPQQQSQEELSSSSRMSASFCVTKKNVNKNDEMGLQIITMVQQRLSRDETNINLGRLSELRNRTDQIMHVVESLIGELSPTTAALSLQPSQQSSPLCSVSSGQSISTTFNNIDNREELSSLRIKRQQKNGVKIVESTSNRNINFDANDYPKRLLLNDDQEQALSTLEAIMSFYGQVKISLTKIEIGLENNQPTTAFRSDYYGRDDQQHQQIVSTHTTNSTCSSVTGNSTDSKQEDHNFDNGNSENSNELFYHRLQQNKNEIITLIKDIEENMLKKGLEQIENDAIKEMNAIEILLQEQTFEFERFFRQQQQQYGEKVLQHKQQEDNKKEDCHKIEEENKEVHATDDCFLNRHNNSRKEENAVTTTVNNHYDIASKSRVGASNKNDATKSPLVNNDEMRSISKELFLRLQNTSILVEQYSKEINETIIALNARIKKYKKRGQQYKEGIVRMKGRTKTASYRHTS